MRLNPKFVGFVVSFFSLLIFFSLNFSLAHWHIHFANLLYRSENVYIMLRWFVHLCTCFYGWTKLVCFSFRYPYWACVCSVNSITMPPPPTIFGMVFFGQFSLLPIPIFSYINFNFHFVLISRLLFISKAKQIEMFGKKNTFISYNLMEC